MPFNPSPTGYFNGILSLASGNSVPTSGVFIPYDSLESYNPSTSGDIRQLVYSFINAVDTEYSSLANADKPTKMTISKSSFIPSDNLIRNTYTVVVNLSYGSLTVVNE